MKRLELVRLRSCRRCGRPMAELRTADGITFGVALDASRAWDEGETRTLPEVVLEHFTAAGVAPAEVVLDVADGRLQALLSLVAETEEPEVVRCTADEGLALALRGRLKLYATDEALAHAVARTGTAHGHGSGGDTVH